MGVHMPIPVKEVETRIRVRTESRPLWQAITEAKGWTFSEAAHRIAEQFCAAEGIEVPTFKPRKKKA